MPRDQQSFALEIPLDASQIEDRGSSAQVKVLVVADGKISQSQIVKLDKKGKGTAAFKFKKAPRHTAVYFGPESAGDDELDKMETLSLTIGGDRWRESSVLQLKPVLIPLLYWRKWLYWCRTFVITGKVVCPDTQAPVAGAEVCAYDVDAFWWWWSKQKVACATTDQNGVFTMKFRWCCGWLPWWWWRLRRWYYLPKLSELIQPHLQLSEKFGFPTIPTPKPDPKIFEKILERDLSEAFDMTTRIVDLERVNRAGELTISRVPELSLNHTSLVEMREPLLERLPSSEVLRHLKLWPWYPFYPWRDCTPDIIFRVTQDCGEGQTVILDESYTDARWNIDTYEEVVLKVSGDACCVQEPIPDPDGYCALVDNACGYTINNIGGNDGTPGPDGYANPGVLSNDGDRPFAGVITIHGQLGDEVAYYDFEFSDNNGASWDPVPDTAMNGFSRLYWIPGTTPDTFQYVPFRHIVDGQVVYKTRRQYEKENPGLNWGSDTYWTTHNYQVLMPWNTLNPFLNGAYRLRLRGYKVDAAGHLFDQQVLPVCSTNDLNSLIIQVDNRRIGAGSGHPLNDPARPCGTGTVHHCTLEPDTEFLDVRIRKADNTVMGVGACNSVQIQPGDKLEVDFTAYDPEGHLRNYTLESHYGLNAKVNLLGLPGAQLKPLTGGSPHTPEALQAGPTYHAARNDPSSPALPPNWAGGAMSLIVDAQLAFPETCCYQLKLWARKRTIVNCNSYFWNTSELSFMVST